MNRLILIPLLATAAVAAQAQTYVDNARVRNVQPQYENITVPRQECTSQIVNETHRVGGRHRNDNDGRNYGGAVIGGVAGAVLGNQVGNGHGREAATALGAVLGAFTGDRVANNNNNNNRDRYERYETVPREVTTCQNVNEVQSRLTGYQVAYEYRGQQFTTVMPQNPGNTLQVRVTVEPVLR